MTISIIRGENNLSQGGLYVYLVGLLRSVHFRLYLAGPLSRNQEGRMRCHMKTFIDSIKASPDVPDVPTDVLVGIQKRDEVKRALEVLAQRILAQRD